MSIKTQDKEALLIMLLCVVLDNHDSFICL